MLRPRHSADPNWGHSKLGVQLGHKIQLACCYACCVMFVFIGYKGGLTAGLANLFSPFYYYSVQWSFVGVIFLDCFFSMRFLNDTQQLVPF